MRTKFLIWVTAVASLLGAAVAQAGYDKHSRDLILPKQKLIEPLVLASPVASNSAYLLSGQAVGASGATVTSFLAQPDVPRNITVTTGGTTGNIGFGNVVIQGTDYFGAQITENILIQNGQTGTLQGKLAFASVTSISFPAEQSPYAGTFNVGIGSVLGIDRCMDDPSDVLFAALGGVYESTRPTVTSGNSVASNTVQLSSALNGSKVKIAYIQNYRCLPNY